MKSPEERCLELLDQVLDGSISDPDRAELSALLDNHPQLAAEIVEQLRTHSLLLWHCHTGEGTAATPLPVLPLNASRAKRKWNSRGATIARKWPWAAVLLVAACLLAWGLNGSHDRDDDSAAVVVSEQGVRWRENGAGPDSELGPDRELMANGRVEMTSGTLTLRLGGGTTLSLSGDVSMKLESGNEVKLDRGRVTADVPQNAKGFTVVTPQARVVDLGTSFGVIARDGTTDIVVFDGKVKLEAVQSSPTLDETLTEGEGMRIGAQGVITRVMNVHRSVAGDQWSIDHALSHEATIKSVRDNWRPPDCKKYYELIPAGLRDDVPAYVDSPGQWNGLTMAGLPAFLRNADYVKTFNNDQSLILDLGVSVDLARPAMVYIFFDRRVPAPKWLTDEFESTGVDIGLDKALAVGGGQGIDHVFSVWQKRCAQAGTIRLGPAGDKSGQPRSIEGGTLTRPRAMYGIAARALDSGQ